MFVLPGSPLPPLPRPARFFSRPGFRQIETIAVPHLNHDDVEPMDASLRGSRPRQLVSLRQMLTVPTLGPGTDTSRRGAPECQYRFLT